MISAACQDDITSLFPTNDGGTPVCSSVPFPLEVSHSHHVYIEGQQAPGSSSYSLYETFLDAQTLSAHIRTGGTTLLKFQ